MQSQMLKIGLIFLILNLFAGLGNALDLQLHEATVSTTVLDLDPESNTERPSYNVLSYNNGNFSGSEIDIAMEYASSFPGNDFLRMKFYVLKSPTKFNNITEKQHNCALAIGEIWNALYVDKFHDKNFRSVTAQCKNYTIRDFNYTGVRAHALPMQRGDYLFGDLAYTCVNSYAIEPNTIVVGEYTSGIASEDKNVQDGWFARIKVTPR